MKRRIKTLTKDYILQKITQEEIFSRFLLIPLNDISDAAVNGTLLRSAFRSDDNTPSMGFKYNSKGKLICRDFGGFFWGDCFDAVVYTTPGLINANNNRDFVKTLIVIGSEFNLLKGSNIDINVTTYKPDQIIKRFTFDFRDWDNNDNKFWSNNGISIDTLKEHNVYPISKFYIEGYNYAVSSKDYPVYGFFLGVVNNHPIWKVYLPKRKPKYMGNKPIVQGVMQIKNAALGGIVKSLKEVMLIAEIASKRLLSLQGTAPSSESSIITYEQYAYLCSQWNNVGFTISDFDRTGIMFAQKHKRLYNTTPFLITDGRYNSINFKVKDLTDMVAYYGFEVVADIVEYVYNNFDNDKSKIRNYVDSKVTTHLEIDTPF